MIPTREESEIAFAFKWNISGSSLFEGSACPMHIAFQNVQSVVLILDVEEGLA